MKVIRVIPIRIGLFLLEVVIKVVIEVIETRFFIGHWVVGRQAIVVTDVEVIVAIIVRADDKGVLAPPDITGGGTGEEIEAIWLPGAAAAQRLAPPAVDKTIK